MRIFESGSVVLSVGVSKMVSETDQMKALNLHLQGHWSNLSKDDQLANENALKFGDRIITAYKCTESNHTVWTITESDRSTTTLMLPEEM